MNKYLIKHYIKSGIIICFILLFAIISTKLIYDKFNNANEIVDPEENFEVVFHEKEKNKLTIEKVNPVSEAVGLSFKANTITVRNNNGKDLKYSIRIIDDVEEYIDGDIIESKIPVGSIKIGYHKNKERNDIKLLSELSDNTLVTDTISPGEEAHYTIRVWIDNDTNINIDKNSRYHGLIEVKEIK